MSVDNFLYSFINISITFTAMAVLDVHLVLQNDGKQKFGVLILLLAEEFCHLLTLKYIGAFSKKRLETLKRGRAIISWFLFIVIYNVKLFFIFEDFKKKCSLNSTLKSEQNKIGKDPTTYSITGDLSTPDFLYQNVLPDQIQNLLTNKCKPNLVFIQFLFFSNAVFLPTLYFLLVGEAYIKDKLDIKDFAQIKLRTLWTITDILELIQLQSMAVEEISGILSQNMAVVIFFYSYALIAIIPSMSLTEMSRGGNENFNLSLNAFIITRIVLFNIGSVILRLSCLILERVSFASMVFMGKNVVMLVIELSNILHVRCSRADQLMKKIVKSEDSDGKAKFVNTSKCFQSTSSSLHGNAAEQSTITTSTINIHSIVASVYEQQNQPSRSTDFVDKIEGRSVWSIDTTPDKQQSASLSSQETTLPALHYDSTIKLKAPHRSSY